MITAIVQARVGSTRYPNKIFAEICGKPIIWHIINRLRYSSGIDKIVIATTINLKDDLVESWAIDNNLDVYRGSEEDVLERYYNASMKFGIDTIVRTTSDDPFKDPEIIDKVIDLFYKKNLDFAYNNNPPSFPEGLDAEVFSFGALETAQNKSYDNYEREHVTQYFYRNPARFRQMNLLNPVNYSYLRWTVDTQQDFDMVNTVYQHLYKENEIFLMKDILQLLERNPQIPLMNADVKRSDMYIK